MGLNENACAVLSAVVASSGCSISSCVYGVELGEGRLEGRVVSRRLACEGLGRSKGCK